MPSRQTGLAPNFSLGAQILQGEGSGGGPRYLLRGGNDALASLEQAIGNAREQAQKFVADAGTELGPFAGPIRVRYESE
jgi:hypothetical protein